MRFASPRTASALAIVGLAHVAVQPPAKSTAFATTTPDAIDAYVAAQMKARRIPGAAIAVVQDGRLVIQRTYGIANLETNTPVTTGSVFQVASLTKQFTAAAVMLLVEEGKVQLDAPVATYVEKAPTTWSQVTVRHLLTHTSGLSPGAIVRVDSAGRLTMTPGTAISDITAARTLSVMSQMPVVFPPGQRTMYCDACYFLLGLVIQKASGESYDQFLKHRIFEPAGMTSSGIVDRWQIVPGLVPVYTIRNGNLAPWRRDWQYEVNAFAGVRTTIGDMARWDAALRSNQLLKPESRAAMWTPARLNNGQEAVLFGDAYGFGWTLGELRGHRTVEHAGASGTYILRLVDDGLTVIVLTNLEGTAGSQPATLARGIAGLMKPELRGPESLVAQTDPSPETTAAIKTMLGDMAEGREPSTMTAGHRAFYLGMPAPVRADDGDLLKTLKDLTYLGADGVAGRGLTRWGEPVARIVYYKGQLDSRAFYFTFWLTSDSKVANLRFYPGD